MGRNKMFRCYKCLWNKVIFLSEILSEWGEETSETTCSSLLMYRRLSVLCLYTLCIDDYQFYASIHCLTNWNTVIYKENVGMYREMQKSEWNFLCDQRDCDQRDCPQWFSCAPVVFLMEHALKSLFIGGMSMWKNKFFLRWFFLFQNFLYFCI